MTSFTNGGLYYSGFLVCASALLLLALYFFRWRSNLVSVVGWQAASLCSALYAWLMTGDQTSAAVLFGLNILCVLCLFKLIRTFSVFGLFFFISLIFPVVFVLIWIIGLVGVIGDYFQLN